VGKRESGKARKREQTPPSYFSNGKFRIFDMTNEIKLHEAIVKPLFPHDFAINDFAFIGLDRGKNRDGKIIDGKIMMSSEIASP
jgi:hypothetical protein